MHSICFPYTQQENTHYQVVQLFSHIISGKKKKGDSRGLFFTALKYGGSLSGDYV